MLDFFRITRGLDIDRAVRVLQGAGLPGSSSDTNSAPIGSLYLQTSGETFIKQTAGSGTDKWQVYATETDVETLLQQNSWREPVEVVDRISLVLPTETPGNPIIIDSQTITDQQHVLFAALAPGDANIYIYDQPSGTFTESVKIQTQGDVTIVKRGIYTNRLFLYTGTAWMTYDALYKNTVFVQQDAGIDQFNSIVNAITYVSSQIPTVSNPWTIIVYPGTYIEPSLVIPDYTKVESAAQHAAIVKPTIASNDVFTLGSSSSLVGFHISDATSGRACVAKDVEHALVSELFLENNETDVYIEGNATPTIVHIHDIIGHGGIPNLFNIQIVSNGGQSVLVDVDTVAFELQDSSALTQAFSIYGTGAEVDFQNSSVVGPGIIGTGLYIENGATVSSTGLAIHDVGLGLHIPNVGAAPKIYLQAQIVLDDQPNILIEHPGTIGFFAGAADHDEITIAAGATQLSLAYNGTDAGDAGFSIVGSLLLGSEQSITTDVTDLIQQASPTGVLSGGVLSRTLNPLEVEISSGYGYLIDSVTLREKRVTWTTTLLTVADNAQNYIYIDNNGTITFAGSIPNIIETILLGRARTGGGAIAFLSRIPLVANASATFLDEFLRKAIGPIFGTGSIATENVTPLELDVTGGTYYYSKLTVNPSGGSAITFIKFFHTGGVQDQLTGQTVVDNANYDDLTNLTALTPGWYAKHSLYLAGDGSEETYAVITAQAQYATLLEAQNADLPNPPVFLADIAVPIAALIIQEGNPNIVQIQDIRPRLGFTTPTTSGGIRHGDLLGLSSDDHLQYLLVNGTRSMSGGLNMGGNSITNVNLVDGVDISAHATRHGANSSDPISTAAPPANLTPASTNAAGIANTLARSDHSHAITGFQVQDSDLDALAAIATTGLYIITGTGISTTRTLVGTTGQITISNANGVAGNPTLSFAADTFIQRFTFQADQFDNPVNANWAVNGLASAAADSVNPALTVRRFDDTAEEGVGGEITIPPNTVNVVFYFKWRAQTAPGGAQGVQPTFYHRNIPNNAAVGAWSAPLNLTVLSVPTNTNFQFSSQTISLIALGWAINEHRQFQLTRRGTQVGDTLVDDWNLLEMIMEFTT